ncbi:MAG: CNP1-like family protein [Betaproteobacteria bacterium]|nr:CNP1-like family protein [Betaproteobacteria bacterium]
MNTLLARKSRQFAGIGICCGIFAFSFGSAFASDDEEVPWQEEDVSYPAPPQDQHLLPFYVSPTTNNRFLIDEESLSVKEDGVIRYTLVVISSEGARNVSYEGIRCATGERRIYAFGRSDGVWSKARSSAWHRIQKKEMNRYHDALNAEYFCTPGNSVDSVEKARAVLRNGGNSEAITRVTP